MLSYQHIYHAGNLADVHKHALLAWMLAYMSKKDKSMCYIDTHAGRGLYDLGGVEALKTGEASAGIDVVEKAGWFGADHPYAQVLEQVRVAQGEAAYPGSPLLAAEILRPQDRIELAELHPQEIAALEYVMSPYGARCQQADGFQMAMAICPPTPRRGLVMIDPSYEIKDDYEMIPSFVAKLHRKWNVGVIALWYPILTSGAHTGMIKVLKALDLPDVVSHEVRFAPARPGHGMIGSGMFVVNAPWGLADEAKRLSARFAKLM
jgi:23S rRNA (adenine2030-N6)-methyltransferase